MRVFLILQTYTHSLFHNINLYYEMINLFLLYALNFV